MNNYFHCQEFCEKHGIKTIQNASLKDLSTFKIGGNARLVAEPETEEQLSALVGFLSAQNIPYLVIGRGSNLLFSDEEYKGVILHLGSNFSGITRVGDTEIACLSGTSLTELCKFAQVNGLSGLEFAYGIPGTVGGAIYMNAGAYGGEMKDVVQQTFHLDQQGMPGNFQTEQLEMGYRHSIYSNNSLVITKAVFHLRPSAPNEIQANMNNYMKRRREKQPLEYPSAGSVFRRPAGNYASALVDQCGLKGKQVGAAQVSEKHAGFIVNLGGATCSDVMELIAEVQECVKEQTGYSLECEIKTIL